MADDSSGGTNILKRIIQLVLDKTSAKETQDGVDSVLDKVEDRFKEFGKKIAEFLSVAFLIEGLKKLGEAAVEQAEDSQEAWDQLKGTIDNAGQSFDALKDSRYGRRIPRRDDS